MREFNSNRHLGFSNFTGPRSDRSGDRRDLAADHSLFTGRPAIEGTGPSQQPQFETQDSNIPIENADSFEFQNTDVLYFPDLESDEDQANSDTIEIIEVTATTQAVTDGRTTPDTSLSEDTDSETPQPPTAQPTEPEEPTNMGRPSGAIPGPTQNTPPSPAPGDDNAEYGRPDDAEPITPPDTGTVSDYTSGGPASSSYNVTIEFHGTWTTELQAAFTDAADYLSSIILADIPDAVINGIAIDDITITATLEGIDGVGGVLGSAGPDYIRNDGSYLTATGSMTFDSEDAQNQFDLGNWETIVLHEMMHALGFGTLWSLMGLTTGSVAGGDIRFTGSNATDVYQTEFASIANADLGSLLGVPVETDGGSGTAGGHWDEVLFQEEIMTGYVDAGGYVSEMTIASFEDMGYDTVYDNPYDATDLSGPIPVDPLLDLIA
ncbi:MAG: leishmanolysin-related zinc metalloendopeptidase [Pseudoruegeria sp.]